jgi:hypothetical protein
VTAALSLKGEVATMVERAILAAVLFLSGCAWDAGYQKTSGPSLLRDGVEVRVVGQECYVNRSADEFVRVDDDQLDVQVKLQLKNGTGSSLTVFPEEITLIDSEVEAGPSLQARPATAFEIGPGQSKRFDVSFTRGGELDCSADLSLHLGRSVTVQGTPVTMPVLKLASSH